MSKTVMLDWSSRRFEVTPEGYDVIKRLIAQYQVCPSCRHQIDNDLHLLVAKTCLQCVLMNYPSLKLVGLQQVDSDGDKHYAFLNQEGITFTSEENYSDKPEQDVALSIETAGFRVPVSYRPFKSTEDVQLYRSAWHVTGKLSQSVVILRNVDYHGKRTEVDFIAYKHGESIEFNKRTTAHKNMLENALKLATRAKKRTDEVSLFEIIATLESAAYEAQIAFLTTLEPEEPELIELIVEESVQEPHVEEVQEESITDPIEPDQAQPEAPVQISSRRKRNKQEETSDEQPSTEQ